MKFNAKILVHILLAMTFSYAYAEPRLSISDEMLQFHCPEEFNDPAEKKREDLDLTRYINSQYYNRYLASYVDVQEINATKRNFYEKKGCTETIAKLDADAAFKAQQDIQRQKKDDEERDRRELLSAPATFDSCNVGDRLKFLGGWVVGAAGTYPFADPVGTMERLSESSASERLRIKKAYSLKARFHSGGIGCEGVGQLKKMDVFLANPLGGGKIQGGKYLLVTAKFQTNDNGNLICYLLIKTKDAKCE